MAIHINLGNTDDPRDVVHRAVQALAEGQLVVFPTETVYGVAASALHEGGVAALSELKSRDSSSPFALAIPSADAAVDFAPQLSPVATRLARRCWPGPLTMVLPATDELSAVRQLPESVQTAVSPTGQVGLRVPGHGCILSVLRLLAGPLALTSANLHGEPEAKDGQEALKQLGDHVAMVIDDGPCKFAQASTVVRVGDPDAANSSGALQILREGVINESQLQKLASLMIAFVCTGNTCRSPMAAAMMRMRLAAKLGCQPDELEQKGAMVLSAGVAAMSGARASAEAVSTMAARGIDLADHESQPLTERLARFADVILTLTRGHREAICAQWPETSERVKLVCHDQQNVGDPIGGPESLYQECAQQIDDQLDLWVQWLEENQLLPSI